jgi:AcrR family transcriptional regulator
MARRRNQTARRQVITAAAEKAILARGAHRVRIKDVAEAAGLSSGSISYYYPDIDELLLEVYETGVERFYTERLAATNAIADPRERLLAAIATGLPRERDDEEVRLLYELGTAQRGAASWGSLIRSLYDRQVAMYQAILEVGQADGTFVLADDARALARNFVALEDAYGLHIVTNNPTIDFEVARGLICSYAAMATGCAMDDTGAKTPQ